MTGKRLLALIVVAVSACSSDGGDTGSASTAAAPTSGASTAPSPSSSVTVGDELPSDATVSDAVPDSSLVAPPDPTVFGELGETDVTITGDRGTLQLGDVDRPAGLDPDFPLPDDLAIVLASEVEGSLGVTGQSGVAFDDAIAFYRSRLPSAGYDVEERQFVEGVVAVFAFDGPNGSGDVAVSAGPGGGTTVIVTFER